MDEKKTLNGLPEDVYVEGWVQVRQMLNDAYGEEYVTANPVLIAAGIVAEALYNHSDAMIDFHEEREQDFNRLTKVIFDGFVGMSNAICSTIEDHA